VAIGAALVTVGIQHAVQYLPLGSDPTLLAALEWIITGLLTLIFLWIRPQGLLPEQRRRYRRARQTRLARAEVREPVGT
jgi:ABC-type branched-subunit amino acid transport system permease subunit